MSITDAKDPASWQIGFEDGIKFAIKLEAWKTKWECKHLWIAHPTGTDLKYCTYCEV